MDRRAFITEVLDGQRHRRLPRALFGTGLWAYKQIGLTPEDFLADSHRFADGLTALYASLDTDMLFLGSGLNSFPAEALGGVLKFRGEQAPLLTRPLLGSLDDVRRIEQFDIRSSPRTRALVEMIGTVRRNLPDRFLCATSWGPFTWALILCDWDLLKEKLVTDLPFIAAVGELGVRLSSAFFDLLIDRDLIDAISVPEGSVTLIPRDIYSDHILPIQKKLFDHVRARGRRTVLHMCGAIGPQLPLYSRIGVDVITVDDHVSIRDAYETLRHAATTGGNVDVINVIEKGDEAMIRRAVRECVAHVPDPQVRYILMPSCDLPIATPLANVKTFLSCADEATGGAFV